MKKFLLLATFFMVASIATSEARGVRIPVGNHQKIKQVLELPDSSYYKTNLGRQINVGYMYTVYEIAYVPVWTTEKGRLVGYAPAEPDTYYELDEEMLSIISEDTGVKDLSSLESMPFWDGWGGKLLSVAIIGGAVYFGRSKSGDEEEEKPAETPQAAPKE